MNACLTLRLVAVCVALLGLIKTACAQDTTSEDAALSIYFDPCERALETRALEAQLRIELSARETSFVLRPSDEHERDENLTDPSDAPATLVSVSFARCEPDAPSVLVWTNRLFGPARRIEMVDSPREDRPRNLALVIHELVRNPRAPLTTDPDFVSEEEAQASDANVTNAEQSEQTPASEDENKTDEKPAKRELRIEVRRPEPPLKRRDAMEAGGELRWLSSGDFFLAGPLLSYSITRASPFELSLGATMLTGTRGEEIGTVRATLLSAFVAPRYHLRLPYRLGLELSATFAAGEAFASGTASTSTGTEGSVRAMTAETSARAAFTAALGPLIEIGLFAGIGSMFRGIDIYVRGQKTAALDGSFFNAGLMLRVPLSITTTP